MRHSIGPRDGIYMKNYGFSSFAKNIFKNVSKSSSGKYSQKLLGSAQKSGATKAATDAFETASKRTIKKTVEETGFVIGNKTADTVAKSNVDKITRTSS